MGCNKYCDGFGYVYLYIPQTATTTRAMKICTRRMRFVIQENQSNIVSWYFQWIMKWKCLFIIFISGILLVHTFNLIDKPIRSISPTFDHRIVMLMMIKYAQSKSYTTWIVQRSSFPVDMPMFLSLVLWIIVSGNQQYDAEQW